MRIVKNKEESAYLYSEGMFGNCMPMWNYWEWRALWETNPQHALYDDLLYVIRYKIAGSKWCEYDKTIGEIIQYIDKWSDEAELLGKYYDWNLITIQPTTPDHNVILNAELSRGHQFYPGWQLRYSELPMKMRPALLHGERNASGLAALEIVKKVMTPESYSDLMDLFEIYEDSVMEFTVWKDCLGNVAGRNSIVWEVRNY